MEKQNLFPILSSVKYNKLENNDGKFQKLEKKGVCPINQEMHVSFDSSDSEAISANPILIDDNDSIIDGLFGKNQILQARSKIMHDQIDYLKSENARLNKLLSEEKARCTKYLEKLKYIHANQPVLEKLKQAYISMKYNERSIVEVNERSCQTFHKNVEAERGCQTCKENFESGQEVQLYRGRNIINIEDIIDCGTEPGFMPVKKKEFMALKETVETLKTLIITQPLSSFVLSEQREAKYRKDITELFMDNSSLKQLVIDQQLELDSTKQQLSVRKTSKEINMLKKIIAKLERQMRFANICAIKLAGDEDSTTDLNEKEKKILEHISAKYEFKLQQKKNIYELHSPYYTPRSGEITQRTEGTDTFRSCDDNISFDSI